MIGPLLLAAPALSCTCTPPSTWAAFPPFGARDVAMNAGVWVVLGGDVPLEGDFVPTVNGVEGPALAVDDRSSEGVGGVFLSFGEALPPGASVAVRNDSWGVDVATFTTGEVTDVSAPTWDGTYTVEPHALDDTSCGSIRSFSITHTGTDDAQPADDLLIHVEPVTAGLAYWQTGTVARLGWTEECGGDETLQGLPARVYTMTLFDGAGHATGPLEVRTAECGCTSGGAPAGPVLAMLLWTSTLAAWRRARMSERSSSTARTSGISADRTAVSAGVEGHRRGDVAARASAG